MIEHQVSKYNVNEFIDDLYSQIDEHKTLVITIKPAKIGKWGLARLWRSWMATTAKYMAGKGVTMPLMISAEGKHYGEREFNSNDAHQLFTHKHLGEDDSGNRLSWAKNSHDGMRVATKGERVYALQQHEVWCLEKGVTLPKPRDSEYDQLQKEQES